MTAWLCRVLGHRIERYHVGERVGAIQCTRCWARAIFPAPGVTDAQLDRVLLP